MAPALQGGCAKLVYLHIPKCGGSSVMAAMKPLQDRGVQVVRYKMFHEGDTTYEGGTLAAELAAEARDPLRWPRKAIEVHVRSGAYAAAHAAVMETVQEWRDAGCRVQLATLLREPKSLAKSWFTFCSGRRILGRREQHIEPFWELMMACGRRNVMTNFLATGEFCAAEPQPHNATTVAQLANTLRDFGLLDDVVNLPRWWASVCEFLGEGGNCPALRALNPRKQFGKARGERVLRLPLHLRPRPPRHPIPSPNWCLYYDRHAKWTRQRIRAAAVSKNWRSVPQSMINKLVDLDTQLYKAIMPKSSQQDEEQEVPEL
eukprot:jgi/Tetstr1/431194/TSEL_020906.t1